MRFAQRRLLKRLSRLDDAARQRHLTRVSRRIAAHGQHDVRVVCGLCLFCVLCVLFPGKHQQQACGMTDARDIESWRPLTARHRRHSCLRGRARQLTRERGLEAARHVGERHGAMDMNAQLPCGVGYDAVVMARATSDPMNA